MCEGLDRNFLDSLTGEEIKSMVLIRQMQKGAKVDFRTLEVSWPEPKV